jgi:hypothetical protein
MSGVHPYIRETRVGIEPLSIHYLLRLPDFRLEGHTHDLDIMCRKGDRGCASFTTTPEQHQLRNLGQGLHLPPYH